MFNFISIHRYIAAFLFLVPSCLGTTTTNTSIINQPNSTEEEEELLLEEELLFAKTKNNTLKHDLVIGYNKKLLVKDMIKALVTAANTKEKKEIPLNIEITISETKKENINLLDLDQEKTFLSAVEERYEEEVVTNVKKELERYSAFHCHHKDWYSTDSVKINNNNEYYLFLNKESRNRSTSNSDIQTWQQWLFEYIVVVAMAALLIVGFLIFLNYYGYIQLPGNYFPIKELYENEV